MPRWKGLPDELDPQVKEFAGQLRRLVDRSGLSIAAVADRTGYSKTSWERYLNGRLLAPKGAIVALSEVTGASPVHLTTMWELAERAWSRSEMRHDMTMEAIRISQARAALGEFGPAAGAKGGAASGGGGRQATAGRRAGSATATPGIAGPAGVSPTIPPKATPSTTPSVSPSVPLQPTGRDGGEPSYGGTSSSRPGSGSGSRPGGGAGSGGGGWGVVAPPRGGATTGAPGEPGTDAAAGEPSPQDARPVGAGEDRARRKRRLVMFLAGVVGALVVVAVAVYLTGGGDKKEAGGTRKSPAVSASTQPDLPPGVKCAGAPCTGKDPENMGCGGELATTTTSVTVGTTLVEVRYSRTCGAAWARITRAARGDRVDVSSGTAARQTGAVDADTDAYTPMVAVKDAGDARACATLKTGQKGCTK
ncbi:XRE family transcriptional regulator [Streptomyces sp. NBC_00340]|uniref:helix-turn-helix domain-containing protein n=1 Tax=Streptomyces sp. NBC_00340 TaxID=2975716 RepID=UPI00225072A7|nr:XRE family transcriptional regulator [Streptomyces sp. NBC_00340]MCX5131349.1 XRE family transcriptional regulator [Streptomyces sp. NBC_00340]